MSAEGQQYSKDDIYSAIRNADKAGDTAAVQRLSQYLETMDAPGATAPAPTTPQYEGMLRKPALAAQALAQGAAGLVGLPGDLQAGASWLGNKLHDLALGEPDQATSAKRDASQRAERLPTGSELVDTLGLQGNALVPETPLERYGTAGIKALPAAAATLATGGMGAVPAIAGNVLPALAGQGAHDLAPDSAWAPVVAGLVTGLGVGGITGKVENFLNARAVNKTVGQTEAQMQAAQGNLESARDAAFQGRNDHSTTVQNVKDASKADFAATRAQLEADRLAHHEQADGVISTIASRLGQGVTTLQDAGSALQDHARDWLTRVMPARLEAAWAPVNAAVPKDAEMGLGSFEAALKRINTSAGGLEPLAGLLKPGLPRALGSALDATKEAAELSGAAPGVFRWGDAQKLRTTLGDAMSNPKVVNDVGEKNLSQLYATLTADMRSAAKQHGAEDLFDQANAASKQVYSTAEGPIARVVSGAKRSAEDPAPEAVAKGLLSGGKAGASDLAALREEIPQGVDALAGAHLTLNPKGFAGLSPEAQHALLPDQTQSQSVLTMLDAKDKAAAAASAGVKEAQRIHQANMDEAAKAAKAGNFANASAVRSSAKALRDARQKYADAVEAQKNLPANNILDHSGSSITGLLLGENVGPLIDRALLHGSGLGQAGGAVLGAIAPSIIRGVVNLLKPTKASDLVYPALGAAVGGNALYGNSR